MEKNRTDKKPSNEKVGFGKQFLALPLPLQKRVSKNWGVAFAVALVTVVMMIVVRSWAFAAGLAIAFYIWYLGAEIVHQYTAGQITCKEMRIEKATQILKTQNLHLLLRETDAAAPGKAVHDFTVNVSKKDMLVLTEGMILNAYYRPSNAFELTAWELVGFQK